MHKILDFFCWGNALMRSITFLLFLLNLQYQGFKQEEHWSNSYVLYFTAAQSTLLFQVIWKRLEGRFNKNNNNNMLIALACSSNYRCPYSHCRPFALFVRECRVSFGHEPSFKIITKQWSAVVCCWRDVISLAGRFRIKLDLKCFGRAKEWKCTGWNRRCVISFDTRWHRLNIHNPAQNSGIKLISMSQCLQCL